MTNTPPAAKKLARKMPRGFRRGHDDSLACPHRDVSCCSECAKAHVEIVDVCGAAFWIANEAERAALLAEIQGAA